MAGAGKTIARRNRHQAAKAAQCQHLSAIERVKLLRSITAGRLRKPTRSAM